MSAFRDAASRLAAAAEADVTELWQRHLRGALSERQFTTLAAATIARANRRAVTLADLGIAAQLLESLGDGAPVGLRPTARMVDQGRLADAVAVVLGTAIASTKTPDELAASRGARLARLARSEALEALQSTAGVAVAAAAQSSGQVVGWKRETDADPCPLCRGWAGDGSVFPARHGFPRHKGCACVQRLVFEQTQTAGV